MKKTHRFVALLTVMAITASLAVPAFAKSADDKEGVASIFTTMVGENHNITNPTVEEDAPTTTPSTTPTDGTVVTPTGTSTPELVNAVDIPTIMGWGWMTFPETSDKGGN
ncbi:hypothetical protein [Brevibacillus choshinensis]|uniref:WxL domain-containing protein n=1 Tax=Brevibacillus choshinensis TaxID=54911 RepID=A0ABX7FMH8_BRECH|nr:hypothetical protein [Brevibacillus choshinensis]QRG67337.1 hypothetical protein JNE38_28515 [Brevibacillus choshinensis]